LIVFKFGIENIVKKFAVWAGAVSQEAALMPVKVVSRISKINLKKKEACRVVWSTSTITKNDEAQDVTSVNIKNDIVLYPYTLNTMLANQRTHNTRIEILKPWVAIAERFCG
jgi:hypothetical protein